MILTGLFAYSLSGLNLAALDRDDSSVSAILTAALFVLIGCCIDIGKYLFWLHRKRSWFFAFNSVALTVFSLAASCAFFITAEAQLLEQARVKTSGYNSLEIRIQSIQFEIEQQKQLLQLRLSSDYHSQWEAGEENSKTIRRLQEEMASLQARLQEEGLEDAVREVPISNLYIAVGKLIDVDYGVLRNIGYCALALLLELSALSAMSLNGSLRSTSENKNDTRVINEAPISSGKEERLKKLAQDIKEGKISPAVRAIKATSYGLGTDSIRMLLNELLSQGVLKRGKRNRYQLAVENDGRTE